MEGETLRECGGLDGRSGPCVLKDRLTAGPREDWALRLKCFIKHNKLDTEHFR